MVPATGAILPAAVAGARRRVARYFLSRDAVRPNDAVQFATRSPVQRRMFERLLDAGVIRSAGNDRYFLDVVAFDEANEKRRKRVMTAAGAAVGFAVLFGLLR